MLLKAYFSHSSDCNFEIVSFVPRVLVLPLSSKIFYFYLINIIIFPLLTSQKKNHFFPLHPILLPLTPKVDGSYFSPACLSVYLSVSRIYQEVMHQLRQNLVDSLGVWQRWIDSILVNIFIRIQIREFSNDSWPYMFDICMISQNIIDGIRQSLVDDLGRWQEQAE